MRNIKIILSDRLPEVEITAVRVDAAKRQLEEVAGKILFDNDLIRENARKFGEAVERYFVEKTFPRRAMFSFSHCPEIFSELWGGSQNLFMPKSVLDKLTRLPTDKFQGHNIPMRIIKQLPIAIHDPIAIFNSATDMTGKTLVALLDLQSPDPFIGKLQNLCMAIEFDVEGHVELIGLVKSAYGKSNRKYVHWFLEDCSALYVDTKRARKWLPTAGLQLPGGKSSSGLKRIILSKESFVKDRIEKILPEIEKAFSADCDQEQRL